MKKIIKKLNGLKKIIKKNYNSGMSLMETVIWSGLVAIMAGIVGFSAFVFWNKAKVGAAKQEINIYSTALLEYFSIEGSFPAEDQGLKILVDKKYLKINDDKDLNDPWGEPYVYTVINNGAGYELKTFGADKQEGGEGDKKDIIVRGGDVGDEDYSTAEE